MNKSCTEGGVYTLPPNRVKHENTTNVYAGSRNRSTYFSLPLVAVETKIQSTLVISKLKGPSKTL